MLNYKVIVLILGMTLVTYIPRALPAMLSEKIHFRPKMEKFLNLIPYTAMAALIFPGIFTVDTARPEIGLIGGTVAAVAAWLKCPLVICVLAAIAADLLLYTVF